jgi:hypothetical protein
MPADTGLLLMDNPRLFMQAVLNDDPQARVAGLHTFDDFMTCEFLRYGIFNNPSQIPELTRMYNEFFMQAPAERRREVYSHVAAIVPQLGGHTAGAFTPFMLLDDNIGIVSTATIDYVSLGTLLDNDPMSRAKDVLTMVTQGVPHNPAAVVGGLLAIGDPRVCALVVPLRGSFGVDQTRIITQTFSGITTKSLVEFYLDWLEGLVERDDHLGLDLFGHVAAGLHRLADKRLQPWITDGLRPFPVSGPEAEVAWSSMTKIDPTEFADSIANRLYDLERRESAPKVMPHVVRAFGLIPRTQLSDTALMQ